MKKHPTLIILAALAACSGPAAPKLDAGDGWARATGSGNTAAAYVTIHNKGGADRLTGVRAAIGTASLHESVMDGGVVRMRPIDPREGMSVPSNGKLILSPGGAHLMITGLKRPLEPGDRFPLTLEFDRARAEKVVIEVRPANADGPAQ